MNHFATSKSDALLKLGANFRPFLTDNKLRIFVLMDNVIDDQVNQAASNRMLDTLHQVLKKNHRYLESYAKVPSYANRIRASMMLDLAISQAKRRMVLNSEEEGSDNSSSQILSMMVPSMTVLLLGNHSAIMCFGKASGIYHIRNGNVRYMSNADAEGARPTGLTKDNTQSKTGDDAIEADSETKTNMIDMDVQPGDHFLLASDGLISVVGKGKQVADLCKEGYSTDLMSKLVDQASGIVRSNVVTGILVKSLGVVRDPAMVAKLEPLRRIPLLRRLTDPEMMKILAVMKVYGLTAGQPMPVTPEDDRTLYICLAGKIDLILNGKKLGEVSPETDQFGFLNSWPPTVRMVATLPTKLLVIPTESIKWLRDNEPSIANKLFWEILDSNSARSKRMVGMIASAGTAAGVSRVPEAPNRGASITGNVPAAPKTSVVPSGIPGSNQGKAADKSDGISLMADESSKYTYKPPKPPTADTEEDVGDL